MKARLKKLFLPDIFADTVFDIDVDRLAQNGIKAFIFDIDNTLATYAMPTADKKTLEWLGILQDKGFGIYFVSNNKKARVKKFAQNAGIPYAARAFKPCKRQLLRACGDLRVKPSEAALVGDQIFTDVCGGNRLDMLTVLVKPISVSEDWFVKFKRGFEARLLASIADNAKHADSNTGVNAEASGKMPNSVNKNNNEKAEVRQNGSDFRTRG